jgi:hypothetical protein
LGSLRPGDEFEQLPFTGAFGPDDSYDLASGYFEVNVFQPKACGWRVG